MKQSCFYWPMSGWENVAHTSRRPSLAEIHLAHAPNHHAINRLNFEQINFDGKTEKLSEHEFEGACSLIVGKNVIFLWKYVFQKNPLSYNDLMGSPVFKSDIRNFDNYDNWDKNPSHKSKIGKPLPLGIPEGRRRWRAPDQSTGALGAEWDWRRPATELCRRGINEQKNLWVTRWKMHTAYLLRFKIFQIFWNNTSGEVSPKVSGLPEKKNL